MSGIRVLARPVHVAYIYDGSYDGFLCCVHESVYRHELPSDIWCEENAPITMLETRYIKTDAVMARAVESSIPKHISIRAEELVNTVFFSCLPQKELKMLTFLLRGYNEGRGFAYSLGDKDVAPLLGAEKHLLGEAHLLTGFVRFADVGGALVSTITPKNYILPFIAKHFFQRYKNESFMIYDKTNKAALAYQNGKAEIISVVSIEFPEITEAEARYQELWKRFYDTIAIESRINPRCRMTHMPKRYWENMLEVMDLV